MQHENPCRDIARALPVAVSCRNDTDLCFLDADELQRSVVDARPSRAGALNVTQQADVMFLTFYVFGSNGQPTWYTALLLDQGPADRTVPRCSPATSTSRTVPTSAARTAQSLVNTSHVGFRVIPRRLDHRGNVDVRRRQRDGRQGGRALPAARGQLRRQLSLAERPTSRRTAHSRRNNGFRARSPAPSQSRTSAP